MTEQEFFQEIGKRIKNFRTQSGLTQQDVAEKADVYRADVSALENGKEKIKSVDIIRRIVESTGHTMGDLFAEPEKKTPSKLTLHVVPRS